MNISGAYPESCSNPNATSTTRPRDWYWGRACRAGWTAGRWPSSGAAEWLALKQLNLMHRFQTAGLNWENAASSVKLLHWVCLLHCECLMMTFLGTLVSNNGILFPFISKGVLCSWLKHFSWFLLEIIQFCVYWYGLNAGTCILTSKIHCFHLSCESFIQTSLFIIILLRKTNFYRTKLHDILWKFNFLLVLKVWSTHTRVCQI